MTMVARYEDRLPDLIRVAEFFRRRGRSMDVGSFAEKLEMPLDETYALFRHLEGSGLLPGCLAGVGPDVGGEDRRHPAPSPVVIALRAEEVRAGWAEHRFAEHRPPPVEVTRLAPRRWVSAMREQAPGE